MAYKGETYLISLKDGGINASVNKIIATPGQMTTDSKNLSLKGARKKRGGTYKVNAVAVSGAPQIMGIFDYKKPAGTQFIVFATNDGKLWKDSTNSIKPGLAVNKYVNMEQYLEKVFFCNGVDLPQYWDGATATTTGMSLIPTDWAGTNYPKQFIRHGRGASSRLWAIGCPTTPYTVYASENGTMDMTDAKVTTIDIDTGDGYGIVGANKFKDQLYCFGRRQAYLIDDADTSVTNWGYSKAAWAGGVAHWRLIVETPNDMVCMDEDGEIYSVMAAQEYGDYKAASLTKEADMHDWIKANLNLSLISKFHAVYDTELRAVKFFVVRRTQTDVDTCLVYFIDRPPQDAWMIYDNLNYISGYRASCAAVVNTSGNVFKVYTGDYIGFIWQLEYSEKSDNNNAFYAGFKTPPLGLENNRSRKRFDQAWISLEAEAIDIYEDNVYIAGVLNDSNMTLSLDWWVDGVAKTTQTVTATSNKRRYRVPLRSVGNELELQISNNTKDVDFCLDALEIDFLPLGSMVT